MLQQKQVDVVHRLGYLYIISGKLLTEWCFYVAH